MAHGIKASSTDQHGNRVDADQPQAPVENALKIDDALKILVHNATREFGFAPRDVYDGVLDLPWTRSERAAVVEKFNCSKLKTLVEKFSDKGKLSNSSHCVVVIHPHKCTPDWDDWEIDFKSVRIARWVAELMWLEEGSHLWETHKFLRSTRGSPTLAGWDFEVIVHRILSHG